MEILIQLTINLIKTLITTYKNTTIVVSFFIFLFLIHVSGLRKRLYNVLYHDDTVMIGNTPKKVEKVVEEYQPILHYREGLKGYDPLAMYYELIDTGTHLLINYFTFWKDEIHPNFFIHLIYRTWRFIFYGSCADIECIQIKINKKNGNIEKIWFETAACETSQPKTPKHISVDIQLNSENEKYELLLGGCRSGEIIPKIDRHRVHLSVISWNHCYSCWISGGEKEFSNIPLKYMDDKFYTVYRIARRSNPKDLI